VLRLARTTVELAGRGLARRGRLDHIGEDERRYLAPIQDYISRGITPADELLQKYHGAWNGSVTAAFDEYAY
jgi:glutamate--cysteine ligase